jgi:hypothetical protein
MKRIVCPLNLDSTTASIVSCCFIVAVRLLSCPNPLVVVIRFLLPVVLVSNVHENNASSTVKPNYDSSILEGMHASIPKCKL